MPRIRPTRLPPLLTFLALAACGTGVDAPAKTATTEILWDEWGVPHIFAPDTTQLAYAHGWAQAKSHGDLLLRLFGQARGRAAEYWGEEHLDSDRWVHKMGIPARAESWLAAQGPTFREALDAFARGIDDYAAAHADAIADDVEVVLPVTAADILAHLQRSIHFTFLASPREVSGARRGGAGSNAWAVAPSRSASGHALLVANPHLPWLDLFTWFEVQLVTPEVNISGATLVGSPFIGIGFNDHLGWTHTVNTHDGADLYELELAGGGYRFDGEVRPFETERRTLKVKRDDGSLAIEELEIRRSVHGPVVAEGDGKALALRVVGLDRPQLFAQYWDMARATNLAEFEAAQRRLQMPLFTVMYADRDGHVMHLFGGLTPKRPSGDWSTWSGVVPGTSSDNLWTETHPYEDLPRTVDPPSGWLQNANDPPWTTTFPAVVDADDFPPYMAPRFMHFRAQQSARMLMDDESITFDELAAYKLSTRMRLAERVLDDLEAAVAAHGSERARRALAVLRAWDRTADAASRGGVLFAELFREIRKAGVRFAVAWDEQRPLETPDGFADLAAAAAALDRAAATVEERHGALDAPWGDVYRLHRDGRDLPANGGPGDLGIFRVVDYRVNGDGTAEAFGGDSYVAVVELADPVRARALLSYGNASQPGSPHAGDQLELFARKELRPVWRTRAEIEAHLEERETF